MDKNKGITSIAYNHLNLPVEIIWSSTKKIEYLYNAAGGKVQKKVTNGTNIKTTDYLDGFQYNQQVLEFFPHAEGYVKATNLSLGNNPNYVFNYVYNYTDHLGNVRVSYTKDPQTGNLKILDESHYYPFGLKHQEYQASSFTTNPIQGVIIAPLTNNPYKYKYNGKEWQDELGLNFYDYGWRNYMPDLGRWATPDPLLNDLTTTIDFDQENEDDDEIDMIEAFAAKMEVGGGVYNPYNLNPYGYGYNNPVSYDDPDGRCPSCIGALLGAATDYGLQVAGNLIEGKSLGQSMVDVDGKSIVTSALSGATGAGLVSKVSKVANLTQKITKAEQLSKNVSKGAKFEKQVVKNLEKTGHKNVQKQVTIKPNNPGTKNVKVDAVSTKNGKIKLTEAKSSKTAPLTKNQKAGYPAIKNNGGTVVGKGKPGYPGGTKIPPTKVDVVRPK